jgi:hypothetical protein
MSETPKTTIPRHETHGDDMTMGSQNNDRKGEPTQQPMVGSMMAVHCHECWKYTDDMRREVELMREAVVLIANSGTLAVENSEAFKAADKFLSAKFNGLVLGSNFRL